MSAGFTFPRAMRLTGARRFRAVYEARARRTVGPLVIYAKPNALDHSRLGLAVPRRVGNAPRRNRIKRLLREAFRHLRRDLPCGYDVVVNVRAHEPLALADYQRLLAQTLRALHRTWSKDGNSNGDDA
jgi:ribonuclease P protein component